MVWTTLTNGTLPDADEVMGNFDEVRQSINFGRRSDTFGGTGADGAKTVSSSENIAGDQVLNYTNLTIDSGQTWTVNSGNWLYVKCTGNLSVVGDITIAGRGGSGGTGETGGGNNATSGGAGWYGVTGGLLNNADGGGNGGGSYAKGSAGSGAQTTSNGGGAGIFGWASTGRLSFALPQLMPFWGGGGGGAGINTATAGQNGGAGGGLIIFEVTGNVSISGTIYASGVAGGNGTSGQRNGGGGGGGGCIIILYKGTLSDGSATYDVSGGAGGTAYDGSSFAGGDGSDGQVTLLRAWDGVSF